jgi:polysaccharide biosynthesis/export protein
LFTLFRYFIGQGEFVMRDFAYLIVCAVLLSGCVAPWDREGVVAPPGGVGILPMAVIAGGPGAVSAIPQLPRRNSQGAIPPFGARGQAAAYEYIDGYRLGAGDKVSVKVLGEPDLTGQYTVDPSGNISMPYVQSLQVAGLTSTEVESRITARLKRGYLRNPQVAVQATDLRPFYIMGEVGRAGSFPYQPGMTVQEAIAIAGGYSPRANKKSVMLTRRNSEGTQSFKVPLSTQIYPGDVIYIRERWF